MANIPPRRDPELARRVARLRLLSKGGGVIVFPWPKDDARRGRMSAVRGQLYRLKATNPRFRRSYWCFDQVLGYDLSNVYAIFGIKPKQRDPLPSDDE